MSRREGARVELKVKERDELLASLEDLSREHAAGDLSDEDFDRLRRRYVAKASSLVAEIERLAAEPASRRSGVAGLRRWLGRRRVRRVLVVLLALWCGAAISIAALHFAGVRLPGETATGSISVPQALQAREELAQAAQLGANGNPEGAITLYARVLASDPNQPVALAGQGWLIRLTGRGAGRRSLIEKGDAEIAKAVAVAPGYAEAHALDAVALAQDQGRFPDAVGQLNDLLAEHPSRSVLAPFRSVFTSIYHRVRLPVPGAIARS